MSISIAIVEDLDVIRNGLKDFISLSTDFLVVGSFKTGEEALQQLPDIRPDIVIMDINLPANAKPRSISRVLSRLDAGSG